MASTPQGSPTSQKGSPSQKSQESVALASAKSTSPKFAASPASNQHTKGEPNKKPAQLPSTKPPQPPPTKPPQPPPTKLPQPPPTQQAAQAPYCAPEYVSPVECQTGSPVPMNKNVFPLGCNAGDVRNGEAVRRCSNCCGGLPGQGPGNGPNKGGCGGRCGGAGGNRIRGGGSCALENNYGGCRETNCGPTECSLRNEVVRLRGGGKGRDNFGNLAVCKGDSPAGNGEMRFRGGCGGCGGGGGGPVACPSQAPPDPCAPKCPPPTPCLPPPPPCPRPQPKCPPPPPPCKKPEANKCCPGPCVDPCGPKDSCPVSKGCCPCGGCGGPACSDNPGGGGNGGGCCGGTFPRGLPCKCKCQSCKDYHPCGGCGGRSCGKIYSCAGSGGGSCCFPRNHKRRAGPECCGGGSSDCGGCC